MRSTMIVKDLFAEALFNIFYQDIIADCGDGAAVICCNNPKEIALEFEKWWVRTYGVRNNPMREKPEKFYHKLDTYMYGNATFYNFHDSNENFMFADKVVGLAHGDIAYIIEEDCHSYRLNFTIESVKQ